MAISIPASAFATQVVPAMGDLVGAFVEANSARRAERNRQAREERARRLQLEDRDAERAYRAEVMLDERRIRGEDRDAEARRQAALADRARGLQLEDRRVAQDRSAAEAAALLAADDDNEETTYDPAALSPESVRHLGTSRRLKDPPAADRDARQQAARDNRLAAIWKLIPETEDRYNESTGKVEKGLRPMPERLAEFDTLIKRLEREANPQAAPAGVDVAPAGAVPPPSVAPAASAAPEVWSGPNVDAAANLADSDPAGFQAWLGKWPPDQRLQWARSVVAARKKRRAATVAPAAMPTTVAPAAPPVVGPTQSPPAPAAGRPAWAVQ